jgi:GNAT superfamily N-acetyltransferase
MLELPDTEFTRCLPKLRSLQTGSEVAGAVFAGQTTGRVVVGSQADEAPFLAYVNGFAVLGGPRPDEGFALACLAWLDENSSAFLILYPGDGYWSELLEKISGPQLRRRARVAFKLDDGAFSSRGAMAPRADCEILALDAARMRQASEVAYPWMAKTWQSPQAFERHGLGVCAMVGGEIACVCYSVFVSGGHHEVDILTVDRFRNQGFGRATASAFVERALAGGRQPGWNCYEDNAASCRLAHSLGFEPVERFHVFAR